MKQHRRKDNKLLMQLLLAVPAILLLLMVLISYKMDAPDVYNSSLRKKEIPVLQSLPENHLFNAGNKEQLDALPGVGEVIALRIIESRNNEGLFHFPEDLMSVKGIGDKKYADIMKAIGSMTDLSN
ncbi:MAG: helix-hairpin-helix domain-containing protein [Clostridia bacterium]|nr:helix-hairpin-helix domain-containing protein [Clostridia bacterium]